MRTWLKVRPRTEVKDCSSNTNKCMTTLFPPIGYPLGLFIWPIYMTVVVFFMPFFLWFSRFFYSLVWACVNLFHAIQSFPPAELNFFCSTSFVAFLCSSSIAAVVIVLFLSMSSLVVQCFSSCLTTWPTLDYFSFVLRLIIFATRVS